MVIDSETLQIKEKEVKPATAVIVSLVELG